MKKVFSRALVAAALISPLCLMSTGFAQNKLVISGNLFKESCQIDGTNGDVKIDFGNVSFDGISGGMITRPFQLKLTGCPVQQTVTVELSGTIDHKAGQSDNVLALDSGTGYATGAGVSVFDKDGYNWTFDGHATTKQQVVVDESGNASFDLTAGLAEDSTGSSTAGTISASADIVLSYL
ncbi:TPA: type 1 fimbrial protein [Klebsiella aerogenes]|nr:type 1 fimbrial protein [Klebsiella aerogenes]